MPQPKNAGGVAREKQHNYSTHPLYNVERAGRIAFTEYHRPAGISFRFPRLGEVILILGAQVVEQSNLGERLLHFELRLEFSLLWRQDLFLGLRRRPLFRMVVNCRE